MKDFERRHTAITFVQPAMLKVVALAATVWGVGTPIVLAIKLGDPRLLLLAPLGLLLVPAIVVLAMFGRVMLWVHLMLFWYVRGAIAAISLLVFAGLSCAVLTMPVSWLDEAGARLADGLPTNALAIGAIIGVMAMLAIGAAWYLRRPPAPARAEGGSLSSKGHSPPANSPPLIPPTGAPRPLTYLEHRQGKTPPN